MPEFHYYCTRSEYVGLLDAVLTENRLRCAVDKWYESPFCELYTKASPELVDQIIGAKRHVFLVGDFTVDGLCFNTHDSGPLVGRYSIDISRKGPVMSLTFPTWFKEEGLTRIASGRLHYQARYYDEDINYSSKPSAELQSAYKAAQKTLKRQLRAETILSPIWISDAALALINTRQSTILVNGNWVGGPIDSPTIVPRYRRSEN